MADRNQAWQLNQQVLKYIRDHSLFGSGDTIVVAVSGGADSAALLHLLASMTDLRLNLVVAHLNHALRGAESDGEEVFVRQLALDYQLHCEVRRTDVKALSKRDKLSLEEAGRVARYAFLYEVAAMHGAHAIAVAHHADDQAETVLMRLLRGSGAPGLAGMSPKTGFVVRPLLRSSRNDILSYLKVNGISYCNDSSNADTTFLRNRIRHELMPCLATYNCAITERLVNTAETLAADEILLEELTDAAFGRHGKIHAGMTTLSVPGVMSEPKGLRLRLYRRAIMVASGDVDSIASRHLNSIDELVLSSRPNSSLDVPRGLHVRREYSSISFVVSPDLATDCLPEIILEASGSYDLLNGGRLIVSESCLSPVFGEIPPTVAYFDAAAAPFPWVIRSFRAGDRIHPLGMAGHQKVKTIFIDKKVPLKSRRRFPLLFSAERLIWVGGIKVSEETKVTARTERVLRAEILDFSPLMDL